LFLIFCSSAIIAFPRSAQFFFGFSLRCFWLCFLPFGWFSCLSGCRADGWGDFSNLAADLAPILALFGEQMTKQYLSESITIVNYFIFAMAPIGILTAIISAIRVCGSPSLRDFIGRAQEGGGIAEAELCPSTSRDVCKLYNNGGTARVFGCPKLLEVVSDPSICGLMSNCTIGSGRSIMKTLILK